LPHEAILLAMRASSWKQIFDRRSLRQIEQSRLQGRSATGAASAIRSTTLQAGVEAMHPIAQPLPIHAGAAERFAPSRNLRQRQSARSDDVLLAPSKSREAVQPISPRWHGASPSREMSQKTR
jgi:hypothetical protein